MATLAALPAADHAPASAATAEPGGFTSAGLGGWTWWRRPELRAREIAVVGAAARDDVPSRPGHRFVRFRVSRAQVAAGRQHAKLYKEWAVRAPETRWQGDDGRPLERLPGDGRQASGVYRASFFIPRRGALDSRLGERHAVQACLPDRGWGSRIRAAVVGRSDGRRRLEASAAATRRHSVTSR